MGKKTEEKKPSTVKTIVTCIVLLAILSGLGLAAGIFKNVSSVLNMLNAVTPAKVIKLVIMVVYVVLLETVLKLCLSFSSTKWHRLRTLQSILQSFIDYAAIFVAVCWGLTILGINVSTIFAGIGIAALIVGFGAENLIADVITGLFVVFENELNVGDIVEIDGFRGEVTRIGIRCLCVTDTGGNIKIINHSAVSDLINRSDRKSVATSEVSVSYSTDLEELEKKMPAMLEEIKNASPEIFIGEVKYLGVETLGDSGVTIKVTAQVEERNIYNGRRLLNKEIKMQLDKNGFDIPFPQVTVSQAE